jgi:PAS domain S-box-containing protein
MYVDYRGVALLESKTIPDPQPNLLRQVFDQHLAAVILLDEEGKIQNLNATAEYLLNVPKDSALNQSIDHFLRIYTQDDSNQWLLFPIQSILHQGLSIERLNHAILVNGQGKRMQVECSLLPFEERFGKGAVMIILEQTSPLISEQSLVLTKESLQVLVANIQHGIAICQWIRDDRGTPIDFSILQSNARFAEMFGFSPADFRNHSGAEGFAEQASTLREQFLKLQQGEATVQFETYLSATGRYLQGTAFPIDGERFFAIFHDATSFKTAEKSLARGVQIFQNLIHTVRDAIIIVDLHGRIQLWNEAAERIFGYARDEALGKVVDDLIIPPEAQSWVDQAWGRFIESAKASGEGITFEFECLTKSGQRVPIEVSLSISSIENEWMGIAVVRDIQTRKQSERAIARRDAILTAVGFAAERLLQAAHWQDVIQDILTRLGTATEVDRVYLFQCDSTPEEDEVYITQLYEWTAPGIASQIDNPDLERLPLRRSGYERWIENLSQGEALYGLIAEFPTSEQDLLRAQDILSLAVVPVFCENQWWGFIGFDDCHANRPWSQAEIEALRAAANILGTAIHRQAMNSQIQQSEKKYQTLVEALPVVVYTAYTNAQGALKADYITPNVEELFGYTQYEIINDPYLWINRIHPDDREQAIAIYRQHLRAQTAWDQEYRIVRKDGEIIWVREQAVPTLDPISNIIRAQGIIQDISLPKRRQREQHAIQLVHQALQGNDTLESLLQRLLAAVIHAIPNGEKGSILLKNEENKLAFGALHGYQDPRIWNISFPLDSGYAAKAFRLRQPLIIPDARQDESIRFEGEIEEMAQVQSAIAAPLMLHDQAIGVITVDNCTRKNAFSTEDLHFLSQIAGTAALVVENVRLLDETRSRVRELELIADLSNALRAANDHQEMGRVILKHLLNGLKMETAALRLFDPQTQKPIYEIIDGAYGGMEEFLESFGSQFMETLRKKKSALCIHKENISVNEPFSCRSLVAVPLIAQEHKLGELFACRCNKFSDQDVHLLEAIADISANAFYRATLHLQTEKQLRHLSSLYTIDQAISKRHNLEAILKIIVQEARSQLDVDALAIHLYDPHAQQLTFVAGDGFRTQIIKEISLIIGQGLIGKAAKAKVSIYTPNIYQATTPPINTKLFLEEGFIAHHVSPLLIQDQLKGVIEVFHRKEFNPPQDWKSLFEAFAGQAAIAIDNAQLFEDIQHTNLQLSIAYDATLEGWAKALELRDRETLGHSNRVTELTLHIAAEMGVPNDQLIHIWRGVRLHDIGKMGIPDSILLKAGPLTEAEWEIMRRHPQYAYELLSPIEYLRPALDIPYCHHERWDGSGYPRGLKGEEIPLAARIFAVVDVWDALTSARPYRSAWKREQALEYILEQRGKKFDPAVVDVFLRIIQDQIDKDEDELSHPDFTP